MSKPVELKFDAPKKVERWTILIDVGSDASGKQLSAPYRTSARISFRRHIAGKSFEFGVTENAVGTLSLTERRTGRAVASFPNVGMRGLVERANTLLDSKIAEHGEEKIRSVIESMPSWREAVRR